MIAALAIALTCAACDDQCLGNCDSEVKARSHLEAPPDAIIALHVRACRNNWCSRGPIGTASSGVALTGDLFVVCGLVHDDPLPSGLVEWELQIEYRWSSIVPPEDGDLIDITLQNELTGAATQVRQIVDYDEYEICEFDCKSVELEELPWP